MNSNTHSLSFGQFRLSFQVHHINGILQDTQPLNIFQSIAVNDVRFGPEQIILNDQARIRRENQLYLIEHPELLQASIQTLVNQIQNTTNNKISIDNYYTDSVPKLNNCLVCLEEKECYKICCSTIICEECFEKCYNNQFKLKCLVCKKYLKQNNKKYLLKKLDEINNINGNNIETL